MPPNATTKSGFQPYFVIGYPRSGTTLLLHFLMSSGHFPVYRFSESHFFSHYYRRYGNLRKAENFETFASEIAASRWFEVSGVGFDKIRDGLDDRSVDYTDVFVAIMEEISKAQGMNRWLEKTPWHILYTKEIKKHIPDSKFILIVRDPRDVALSIQNYGWSRGMLDGPVRAAIAWGWHMKKVQRDLAAWPDDVLLVRYENLVEDKSATAEKISGFLGVELDLDTIEQNPTGVMKSANTSYKTDGASSPVYRWKSLDDQKLIGRLDWAIGRNLQEFGYDKSAAPRPNAIDRMSIALLRLAYFIAKQGRQAIFPLVRK